MSELPYAPLDRVLRKAGALRIASKALEAFAKVIEDVSIEVAKEAVLIARGEGRVTVNESDILLAAHKFIKELNQVRSLKQVGE